MYQEEAMNTSNNGQDSIEAAAKTESVKLISPRGRKPLKPILKNSRSREGGINMLEDEEAIKAALKLAETKQGVGEEGNGQDKSDGFGHNSSGQYTPLIPSSILSSINQSSENNSEKVHSEEGTSTIKWDEETIAEHDKERGTRMKIEEPKTPYHLTRHHHHHDQDHANYDSVNNDHSHSEDNNSVGYHSGASSDGEDRMDISNSTTVDVSLLQQKMMEVEAVRKYEDDRIQKQQQDDSMSGSSSENEEEEDPAARAKRLSFAAKRKGHYEEFIRMKAAMNADSDDDSSTSSSE